MKKIFTLFLLLLVVTGAKAADPVKVKVNDVATLINTVNNADADVVIELAAGEYNLTGSGTAMTIPSGISVTIIGAGADNTIIDGSDEVQIFRVSPEDTNTGKAAASLTMEGVTLQKGYASGSGSAINNSGLLSLTNCVLKDNQTDDDGAIYSSAVGALTLVNCALTGNTAARNAGAIRINGTALIMNTTITGNSAGGDGGGLFVDATTTILNSIIVGNTIAEDGEGGDIYNKAGATTIRLAYSAYGDWDGEETTIILGNILTDLSASAVFADPGNSLELLEGSDVATKGTLTGLTNDGSLVGCFKVGTAWMVYNHTNTPSTIAENLFNIINDALNTDPASNSPVRDNGSGVYSMGAWLKVVAEPVPHHELTFLVDEGIRINPSTPAYSIEEGGDYTFYMYMNAGNEDKKPYVTVNNEPVVIKETQDGTGWVYRIPAVYEDKTIEIVLQDLVSNLNPDEAGVMIYSSVGALIVDVAQSTSVTIYNITGQAVAQETVEGRTAFNLPKGVYIIKTDRGTTKAVVR